MADLPHDVFDRSLKLLWKHEPTALLALLPGGERFTRIDLAPTELLIRRQVDGLAWVTTDKGRYALHIEFEADPKADFTRRMHVYNALLHQQLPGNPPVRSIGVLLRKPPASLSPHLSLAVPAAVPYLSFTCELVHLYDVPAAQLAADAALAQLSPLGADFKRRGPALLAQAAHTIRAGQPQGKADRLGVLSLLARAQGLANSAVSAIIQLTEVRMSYAYQEIIDIGKQEGLLEQVRKDVRQVLDVRFPQQNAALDSFLSRCELADLEWLHVEALRARTMPALRRKLEARLQGR
jgi:hypothetical protein